MTLSFHKITRQVKFDFFLYNLKIEKKCEWNWFDVTLQENELTCLHYETQMKDPMDSEFLSLEVWSNSLTESPRCTKYTPRVLIVIWKLPNEELLSWKPDMICMPNWALSRSPIITNFYTRSRESFWIHRSF